MIEFQASLGCIMSPVSRGKEKSSVGHMDGVGPELRSEGGQEGD